MGQTETAQTVSARPKSHVPITMNPKSVEPERAFSATGLFVTKLRNRLNDENVLWLSCVSIMNSHHWKTVLDLINISLINCAGTNSNNFTVILNFYRSKSHSFQNSKKRVFPGFFSQLPETRVLQFCPELETLRPNAYAIIYMTTKLNLIFDVKS